jgi:solute carrier family 25 phosphate transporter 3
MAVPVVPHVKAPEGFDLYSRFALAGALGCSITHGAFTPVDVYAS